MHKIAFAALAPAILVAAPVQASDKDWATASDVGVAALGAWALGVPVVTGDGRGALQAGLSVGAAYAVTAGLKEAFPETRPDGSDNRSFPSGHSSRAFAAAASIYNRRGPGEGIPAMALASFVGAARVAADKHYWYDVVAGAAIGTASGLILTKRLEDRRMAVIPWGDSKGAGATVAMAF